MKWRKWVRWWRIRKRKISWKRQRLPAEPWWITGSVVLFFGFTGCEPHQAGPVPPFLPGLYVNEYETDFCRVADSLIIRRNSLAGSDYSITRRSAFQRIVHGKKKVVEFELEQWKSTYEEKEKLLKTQDEGYRILYSPEKNTVFKNNLRYEKVE